MGRSMLLLLFEQENEPIPIKKTTLQREVAFVKHEAARLACLCHPLKISVTLHLLERRLRMAPRNVVVVTDTLLPLNSALRRNRDAGRFQAGHGRQAVNTLPEIRLSEFLDQSQVQGLVDRQPTLPLGGSAPYGE